MSLNEAALQNVDFFRQVCAIDISDKKMWETSNIAGCASAVNQSSQPLLQYLRNEWNTIQYLEHNNPERIQFKKQVLEIIGKTCEIYERVAASKGIHVVN